MSHPILLVLLALALQGCGSSGSLSLPEQNGDRNQKVAELKRQKENVLYEVQLRQDELDKMEASVKRPGVVGVSREWLAQKNQLQEEIIRLKVRANDLESQISSLSASGKR